MITKVGLASSLANDVSHKTILHMYMTLTYTVTLCCSRRNVSARAHAITSVVLAVRMVVVVVGSAVVVAKSVRIWNQMLLRRVESPRESAHHRRCPNHQALNQAAG